MQTPAPIALFAGLSDEARVDLERIAQPFVLSAGEALFRQGDPPSALFLLDRGALQIATRLPGDEDARVSAIAPGEVVGEFALLDPGPRSATVTATADAAGRFLPARSFLAMLSDGRPGAVEAIDRLRALVASRTRLTLERLARDSVAEAAELRDAPTGPAPAQSPISIDLIRTLGRFAGFDATTADEFLATGEGLAASRGAALVAADAPADHLLLVVRGSVRAAFDRDGRQEQVTVHGPGEWAGLVAAFDGQPQPLRLSAAEDAILFRVPTERFTAWRAKPGVVGQAVLDGVDRQLVRDQRRANRHLGRALALERFNAVGRAA